MRFKSVQFPIPREETKDGTDLELRYFQYVRELLQHEYGSLTFEEPVVVEEQDTHIIYGMNIKKAPA